MEGLDNETLALMAEAIREAHESALEHGPVLVSKMIDGKNYVVEIDKHGNERKIKEIACPVFYPTGTKFEILESLK